MGAAPLGDGGPHAFVASLEEPVLDPDDEHHLAASLRLGRGDPLTVSDGAGRWRACRFGTPLDPTGEIVEVARPEPQLTIGFAQIKGSRPELVVQKLTELGIDRIVPFAAARSVVRSDPRRVERQSERLRRVAREAAMQSRRVWIPEVDPPFEFEQLAVGSGVVRCERGGRRPRGDDTFLLIGPEGGWSQAEQDAVPDAVDLGPHVLRAETAAIAAATLAAAIRSGVVSES